MEQTTYQINWLARFLNHQQYVMVNPKLSPFFGALYIAIIDGETSASAVVWQEIRPPATDQIGIYFPCKLLQMENVGTIHGVP